MKNLLTLLSLCFVLSVHGQTIKGTYKSIVTEHFKNGVHISNVTKFNPGVVNVSDENILIDSTAYTIVKTGKLETADEGYYTKSLLVATLTKKGSYKVLDCILLLKPDKSIAEVMFKKTKASNVSYVID